MRKLLVGFSLSLLLSACGSNNNPTPYPYTNSMDPYGTQQNPNLTTNTNQYPYYQDPNQLGAVQDIPQQQSQPGNYVFTYDGITFLGSLTPRQDPQSICNNPAALQLAANPQNSQPPVDWYWDGNPSDQPQFMAVIATYFNGPRYDPNSIYSTLCR